MFFFFIVQFVWKCMCNSKFFVNVFPFYYCYRVAEKQHSNQALIVFGFASCTCKWLDWPHPNENRKESRPQGNSNDFAVCRLWPSNAMHQTSVAWSGRSQSHKPEAKLEEVCRRADIHHVGLRQPRPTKNLLPRCTDWWWGDCHDHAHREARLHGRVASAVRHPPWAVAALCQRGWRTGMLPALVAPCCLSWATTTTRLDRRL